VILELLNKDTDLSAQIEAAIREAVIKGNLPRGIPYDLKQLTGLFQHMLDHPWPHARTSNMAFGGPSGSGKSTLADIVAVVLHAITGKTAKVHDVDNVFMGDNWARGRNWVGYDWLLYQQLLAAIRAGKRQVQQPKDWRSGQNVGQPVELGDTDFILWPGVGIFQFMDMFDFALWFWADPEGCKQRAIARDEQFGYRFTLEYEIVWGPNDWMFALEHGLPFGDYEGRPEVLEMVHFVYHS
jgi:hypothetical protein